MASMVPACPKLITPHGQKSRIQSHLCEEKKPSFCVRSNRETAVCEQWTGKSWKSSFTPLSQEPIHFIWKYFSSPEISRDSPWRVTKSEESGRCLVRSPCQIIPPGFVLRSDRAFRGHPRVGFEDRKASQRQSFSFYV